MAEVPPDDFTAIGDFDVEFVEFAHFDSVVYGVCVACDQPTRKPIRNVEFVNLLRKNPMGNERIMTATAAIRCGVPDRRRPVACKGV